MPDLPPNPTKPTHKLAASAAPARTRFTSWNDHFAAERRWFAETFARDKVIDMLKQLAWVVPLTLLIWVYAEREQIETRRNETIPFKLASIDPGKTVSLAPRQDSNVLVELQGPRARVQSVLQRLRGGDSPEGLRLEIDRNLAPGEHVVSTASLVGNHPTFAQNGITVTRCQPERLYVVVDEIVEREARVLPPPGVTTLDPATRFEPATVRMRGPASALDRARVEGGILPVYVRLSDDLLRTPGTQEVELPIELPPALRDDNRVSLSRSKIDATLRVRDADVRWTMDAMTINLDQPKSVADKYEVDYSPSLPTVTLIGPKDVIEQISKPDYEPKPYAQLRVSSADVGAERRRKLNFVGLPTGVRVSNEDLNREIEFTVKPKSLGDQ